ADADAGVTHSQLQISTLVRPGKNVHRPPLVREFDAVGQQIVEDLLELLRIQPDRLEFRRRLRGHANPLFARDAFCDGYDLVDGLTQSENLGGQFHFSRLDLGQVEYVVDQLQQMAAAVENVAQV